MKPRIVFLAMFLLIVPFTVSADPVITVSPTIAPNAFGSPSYAAWEANAISALQAGVPAFGSPTSPTYYYQTNTTTSGGITVTGYPSWMGQADPGTVFGPGFASELGNRALFSLHIGQSGHLTAFSISQLSFNLTSTDSALNFGFGAGSYNYGTGYVGLNYGPDGLKGTGDDFLVTSGPNTQLVHELFGRGSGNAFADYCPGCSVAQQQSQLADLAAYINNQNQILMTGTYSLNYNEDHTPATGSGTLAVNNVPEPTSIALLGAGILGLARKIRRRRTTGEN